MEPWRLLYSANQDGCFESRGELDLVFLKNKNRYDVNHPPQKSINLSLDEYLGSIRSPDKYSFWFDFKSVNQEDIHASLIKMNDLVKKYKLNKQKLVIESKNPTMLKLFKGYKYSTSYYLPTTHKDTTIILKTRTIIHENGIDTVSTHADNLSYIQRHLKGIKSILLWAPELNIDNKYHRVKIRKILLSDRRINVLLVRLDSKYYR